MPTPDLRTDDAELVVLSVLADSPGYGYAISKRAAATSEGGVRLGPGVLYPLLSRLEKQGFITSEWEEVKSDRSDEGEGRRRKWYRLSAKGRRRLAQRVQAHHDYLAMIGRFIAGVGRGAEGRAE